MNDRLVAFGHRELPHGWRWATVGELAESINYRHTASAKDTRVGPRFLRITDIKPAGVDWSTVPGCEVSHADAQRCQLLADDLLFARIGSVGKSYLIRDCPEAIFASYLIRVRLKKPIEPRYLFAFFQSSEYWSQINEVQQGIGRPVVNGTKLANLRVPVAPAPEQARIADRIDELFSDLAHGVNALTRVQRKLERYRAAVLHTAVTGRLSATWRERHGPPAEPADALLTRILAARREHSDAQTLAKYAAKGKAPPRDWKSRYSEPPQSQTDEPTGTGLPIELE